MCSKMIKKIQKTPKHEGLCFEKCIKIIKNLQYNVRLVRILPLKCLETGSGRSRDRLKSV